MNRCVSLGLWCVFVGLVAAPLALADGGRGAQLAASCAACHRLDGRGTPSIIGRSPEQLVNELKGFARDTSGKHIMKAVSRSLSDEEIEILAHYLSTFGKQAERP